MNDDIVILASHLLREQHAMDDDVVGRVRQALELIRSVPPFEDLDLQIGGRSGGQKVRSGVGSPVDVFVDQLLGQPATSNCWTEGWEDYAK